MHNYPNECSICGRPNCTEHTPEKLWNNQADQYNQWETLSQDEKDEWITIIDEG